MRVASRLFLSTLVLLTGTVLACSRFGADSDPADPRTDGGSGASSTSGSTGDGGSSGSSDSGGIAADEPVPTGPGVACAERSPKPNVCLDFENNVLEGKVADNYGGVIELAPGGPGASTKQLRAKAGSVDGDNDGSAYIDVGLKNVTRKVVVWTFDFFFDQVHFLAELGQLVLPEGSTEFCSLQMHYEDINKGLSFYRYCTSESANYVPEIKLVEVMGLELKQWINVFVVANFETQTIRLVVTPLTGLVREKTAEMPVKWGLDPIVQLGINHISTNATPADVTFDNFAAYWR